MKRRIIRNKIVIPEKIKNLMQQILKKKFEVFIVGGAVRDHFFGVTPHDFDLFSNASGEEILEIFPQGKILGGKERQEKILTVMVGDVEISSYRKSGDRTKISKSLKTHLSTCDFRLNSIACNIHGEIIDPHNGRSDIRNKVLSFVGEPEKRIKEDPLRILRGVRLAAKFNLNYLNKTHKAIRNNAHKLKELPQERVRDELIKMLDYDICFDKLKNARLLENILPEVYDLVGLDAGHHHNEKDVFEHCNLAYKTCCKITTKRLLRLAAFMHDIGKKPSAKIVKGEITFYHHEKDSDNLAKKLMKRLKFSQAHISYVCAILRNHMMGPVKKMRDSTFARIGDDLTKNRVHPEDMIVMTYSDNQANLTKVRLSFHQFIVMNPFLRRFYEFKYGIKPFNKSDLDIDGKVLIELGIAPGPKIGLVLNNIFNYVHSGKIRNRRDSILEYVNTRITCDPSLVAKKGK